MPGCGNRASQVLIVSASLRCSAFMIPIVSLRLSKTSSILEFLKSPLRRQTYRGCARKRYYLPRRPKWESTSSSGSSATGRIERSKKVRRVSGVVLHTTGGEHNLDARGVILATGGFLNGGLAARRDGNIVETVFNLPVQHSEDRQAWLASSPFEEQPYEKFGLLVNSRMQPLDLHGDPVFENLYAAGGIISGADRQCEGSRQGIDLATAYRAAEAALE